MPKKKHRHLHEEERGVIWRMNKVGNTQQEIAEAIGFTQSSVSKELKRNRGDRGYRPKQAQDKANDRKAGKRGREPVIEGQVLEEVEERLRKKHSPEQISGKLKHQGIRVSHETIYAYVFEDRRFGGDLYTNLRINGKRRYRRRAKSGRVGKIPCRVGIEERPAVVDGRNRYGDWEADLISGSIGSGYLLSLYERKSHLGKLIYLPTKGAAATAMTIIETLKKYAVRTITYDNGLEFSEHVFVSEELGAQGYFCQPYHSWEKGGVENYNGLVRQYFPKGSDFRKISISALRSAEIEINERPRKTLQYRSPSELESRFAA